MRRALAAGLVLAALAARALAGDAEPGAIRREVEAAAQAGDTERALAALDRVLLAQGTPDRDAAIEAARAALEFLPRDRASGRIAALLGAALRLDASDRGGAWTLAQQLRRDLLRRVDVEVGAGFLATLIDVYPNVAEYRHDAARLLLDGGRRTEAREHLEVLFRMAPSDTWAAYTLAVLAEEEGDLDGAVAYYDRLLAAKPQEHRARLLKVRVLAISDREAARREIETALREVAGSPSEAVRADYTEWFTAERELLDSAERRRAEIDRILGRQTTVIAAAAAAWAVLLVAGLRLTRTVRADAAPTTAS